jgi:prepilin-type N-terminal cleavage/methylation domain-containing protein
MSPSRPSPRGVTLIESMAAMVVFTIGIIGVMQMNVLASRQNNLARSRTIASKIARDVADSFERLPFNHPLLNQATTMDMSDNDYDSMVNIDGLVRLENVPSLIGQARPFLNAADPAFSSEGDTTFYQVAWRVWQIPNPERNNVVDQLRILVMVRYPTAENTFRQVTTWAVKTDSRIVTGDPQTAEF